MFLCQGFDLMYKTPFINPPTTEVVDEFYFSAYVLKSCYVVAFPCVKYCQI